MKKQSKLIKEFWDWFSLKEDLLIDRYANQTELIAEVLGRLKRIDPILLCDFGLPEGDKREFVISAQGLKSAFPTVMKISEAAPELTCWTVKAFRPRRVVHMKVGYADVEMDTSNVFFSFTVKNRIMNLAIYYLDGVEVDRRYENIAGAMVENLLGEYDAAMRVSLKKVGVVSDAKDREKVLPLVRLPRIFDEEIEKD